MFPGFVGGVVVVLPLSDDLFDFVHLDMVFVEHESHEAEAGCVWDFVGIVLIRACLGRL